MLQDLSLGDYHVTIVTPETFTTFTPLLPCKVPLRVCLLDSPPRKAAAVGTVQIRSLIEPMRKIIARLRGQLICGKATDLVMSERLLEVETVGPDGKVQRIYVP